MLPKLEYIRHARTKLGLTQRKLASMVGVSTSLINQIEAGKSKPSYETARRIFEVLSELEGKTSKKAGEICSRGIVSVSSTDPVSKAADMMRRQGFSQLPVLDGGKPLGLITEEGIVKSIMDGDPKQIGLMSVSKIMEPTPPIVDSSTPAKALLPLIKYVKAILVAERGDIVGIITASDMLRLIE